MRRPGLLSLLTIALASATTPPAIAQGPRFVTISPGDSVQLVHQSIFERGPAIRVPGKRLDVRYTTEIPSTNAPARLAQADRAAAHFGAEAQRIGARQLSIGICDTRACVERRDPPSEWHLYERKHEGWQRVDPREIR